MTGSDGAGPVVQAGGAARAHRQADGGRGSRSAAALIAVVASLAPVDAALGESLTYVLTPEFGTGRTQVEVVWQTSGRTQSALGVAAEYGRMTDVPSMIDSPAWEGASRVKRQENLWVCTHGRGATLRVVYTVNPKRRTFDDWNDVHRPIAADEFFCGIGSVFLLVPNSGTGVPGEFETTLRWRLPAGYRGVCSWGGRNVVGAVMKPADLRQSVYLAGRLALKSEKREGVSVTVAMVDRFGFDIERFWDMTSAIIEQQCRFMGERAFPDFVVTAAPVGRALKEGEARLAGSGLYNSFALFVAPQTAWSDAIEHLFAHELFHFWNGRTLAAAAPERLCYWFVEGFTDYYALRILYESGHWDAATYAKWVNRHLREYARNPAANASNAEIDAKYWSHRDTVGQAAYQRGHLLGIRWHALAQRRGVAGGLDALMRGLVERGRGGARVTNDSIRRAGVEVLGAWFGDEFDQYVAGAATVEVPDDALRPALAGRTEEVEAGGQRVRVLQFRPVTP